MPFTHDQFLDAFGRYNLTLWPAVVVLWLASAAAFIAVVRGRQSAARSRAIGALLAVHWAWAGLAYHAAFFAAINPIARVFAALFVLEAACFFWFGVARTRLRFSGGRTPRHVAGFAFVAYALLYPALSLAAGMEFPRAPSFGVPCPTTLLTAGLLLLLDAPFPRSVAAVPILWALVGGSGALLLHVPADWALFAAAIAMGLNSVRRRLARSPAADVAQSC